MSHSQHSQDISIGWPPIGFVHYGYLLHPDFGKIAERVSAFASGMGEARFLAGFLSIVPLNQPRISTKRHTHLWYETPELETFQVMVKEEEIREGLRKRGLAKGQPPCEEELNQQSLAGRFGKVKALETRKSQAHKSPPKPKPKKNNAKLTWTQDQSRTTPFRGLGFPRYQ